MGKLSKVLTGLIPAALLLAAILTWGSIFSVLMISGLLLVVPILLLKLWKSQHPDMNNIAFHRGVAPGLVPLLDEDTMKE